MSSRISRIISTKKYCIKYRNITKPLINWSQIATLRAVNITVEPKSLPHRQAHQPIRQRFNRNPLILFLVAGAIVASVLAILGISMFQLIPSRANQPPMANAGSRLSIDLTREPTL